MISIQEYYNDLNENFIKPRILLFENSLSFNFNEEQIPFEVDPNLMELLDTIYKKYDFDLHRQIKPNIKQFYYYQRQICGKLDFARIEIALVFVLFCCLEDKFLDSPRFTNKEKEFIRKKLDAKYLFLPTHYKSTHFQELDVLLNFLREFFIVHKDVYAIQPLIDDIQKAFKSEDYMSSTHLLTSEKFVRTDFHLLIDKSVKFEKSAFLLSVLGDANQNAEEIADTIANIIWLVDDICDFVEDIQCKRKNSLLFLFTNESEAISLTERIEQAYKNLPNIYALLDKEIEQLNNQADSYLYHFIITQIWDWFSNVRRKTENRIKI